MTAINSHTLLSGCIPFAGEWPGAYWGAGGWTHVTSGKDTLRRMYEEKDETTEYFVESTQNLTRAIIEMAQIVKAGVKKEKEALEKTGRYDMYIRRISGIPPLFKAEPDGI